MVAAHYCLTSSARDQSTHLLRVYHEDAPAMRRRSEALLQFFHFDILWLTLMEFE
jgi:hypothetical protein